MRSFCRLKMLSLLNDVLDELEEKGQIEIISDYENEQILVKGNQYIKNEDDSIE